MITHPRTFASSDFSARALCDAKGGRVVSVLVPARNEAPTIAPVVDAIARSHLASAGGSGLVDQILVIDDGSTDSTGELAERAGARVLRRRGAGGKGQAMAAGLEESAGDLIVYLDGDVENTTGDFVTGLLGPLLCDDAITMVKAFYDRPLGESGTGGGRVTELMARPVLRTLFPDLAGIIQPLAGETAAPRSVLEKVGFADGYGVEIALLIDVATEFGADTLAQVDLGVRRHRNRPLAELGPQATEVLHAALERAGMGRA